MHRYSVRAVCDRSHWTCRLSESVLASETCVELKVHMRGVYRTGNHLSDRFKLKDCELFRNHKDCSLHLQVEHRWLFGSLSAASCCSENSTCSQQTLRIGIQHNSSVFYTANVYQVFVWLCLTTVNVLNQLALHTVYHYFHQVLKNTFFDPNLAPDVLHWWNQNPDGNTRGRDTHWFRYFSFTSLNHCVCVCVC